MDIVIHKDGKEYACQIKDLRDYPNYVVWDGVTYLLCPSDISLPGRYRELEVAQVEMVIGVIE